MSTRCMSSSLILSLDREAQGTGRRSNPGHLRYRADTVFVLLVVLRTVEVVGNVREAREEGVKEATQMLNSACGPNSILITSPGLRSH